MFVYISVINVNSILIRFFTLIKFLGAVFDSKLNFEAHIDYLQNKCLKSLNLLKIVAHKDRGADQKTLTLYRTLIRSKIDYCSAVPLENLTYPN